MNTARMFAGRIAVYHVACVRACSAYARVAWTISESVATSSQCADTLTCRCLLHYLNEPTLEEQCNARFFIDQQSKRVFAQTLVVRQPSQHPRCSYCLLRLTW